jgi:hypothetical protein
MHDRSFREIEMEIERDMSILGEMLANGNYRAHVRKAVGSVDAGAGWDAAFGKTLGHRSAILQQACGPLSI